MLLSARLLATAALATRVPLAPRPVAVRARPLVCSGLQRPNSPPLPDHLEDMAEELESGEAQLFDVREPGEVYEGMLAIAQHVPLRCNAFSFPNTPRILLRFIAFYLQTFLFTHTYVYSLFSRAAANCSRASSRKARIRPSSRTCTAPPASACIRPLSSCSGWASSAWCRCRRATRRCCSTASSRRSLG